MDKICETYITNQYNEILKLSRIYLLGNKEKIQLQSSDGVTFSVSKFIFNFLSSLANPEAECILTPIPSNHLSPICHMLNLSDEIQDVTQFAEELKLLGLDFKSCKDLVGSLNEQNAKPIKIEQDTLEKDTEKNGTEVDESEKETHLLEKANLYLSEDVQVKVEDHLFTFSACKEISKEKIPLVVNEANVQNFEDADGGNENKSINNGYI